MTVGFVHLFYFENCSSACGKQNRAFPTSSQLIFPQVKYYPVKWLSTEQGLKPYLLSINESSHKNTKLHRPTTFGNIVT